MNSSHPSPTSLRTMAIAPREVIARSLPDANTAGVYTLTVLVLKLPSGEISARAANLKVADVQAVTIRGALSNIVANSKRLIGESIATGGPVPWIDPPLSASDDESQFLVPLHL